MDLNTGHKQRGLIQTTSKEQASHSGISTGAHSETSPAAPPPPADPWASLRPYIEEYSSDTAPDELNLQWALQEYSKAMTAGMVAKLSELVRAQSRWGGRGMQQGLPADQLEQCAMHVLNSSASSLPGMVM